VPNITDHKGKIIATVMAADPNAQGCDEGVWVELRADDGTKPTICLVKDRPDGPHHGAWYLGVYRNALAPNPGCDLAVTFSEAEGPVLQVIKGDSVKRVNLHRLAELIEQLDQPK